MNALKNFRIIILPLAIFIIIGFALTAVGANKAVPQSKNIINKSQSTKVIPKAKTKIRVPNFMGETEPQAKKIIKKLGFKIGKIDYQTLGKGKSNTVIKQNPKAGAYAAKESQIDLLIWKAKSQTQSKTILKDKYRGKKPSSKIRRGSKSVVPKIQKIGKDFYLIFPEAVKNVSVLGPSGKANQKSIFGNKFKITSSMEKAKGGKLIVKYTDRSGQPSTHEMMISKYKVRAKKSGAPVDGPPAPRPHYPPHHGGLDVISPGQNDFLTAGQQYDIIWDVHGYLTTDCAQVFLYQEDNQVYTINQQILGRDIPGQAGFTWSVPQHLAGSYTVQVRTCDGEAEDFSDSFRINSPNPDLSISGLTVSPSSPDTGDTIRVQGWVTNMGLTPVDSARVRLTVRDPDGIEHQFQSFFSNLSFGNPYLFSKDYKVNRKGTYENIVEAEAILANALDTHLDNNEATINVTIDGLPDLISCAWINPIVNALHQDEVWGFIKNNGDKQSMPSTARIWIEGKGGYNVSVPLLVPGDSHRVERNVTWGTYGSKDFSIKADHGDNIEESREDNNKVIGTVSIAGSLATTPDPNTYIINNCSGNGIRIQDHPYSVTEQSQQ